MEEPRETDDHADDEPRSTTTRWQRVALTIGVIVLALVVVLLLTGEHGPQRHAPPVDHGASGDAMMI